MEEFEEQYDTVMSDKAFSASSSSAKLGGSVKVDGEDVSVQELNDLYTGIKDFEKQIKTDLKKDKISASKYRWVGHVLHLLISNTNTLVINFFNQHNIPTSPF